MFYPLAEYNHLPALSQGGARARWNDRARESRGTALWVWLLQPLMEGDRLRFVYRQRRRSATSQATEDV